MLNRALEQTASRFPEHLAILHGGEAVTFARLNAMALGIQSFFRQAGLQKGDRVLVLLDNGAEYAAVFFGILHAGGVVVPLNPTNTPGNVRYVTEHCSARF